MGFWATYQRGVEALSKAPPPPSVVRETERAAQALQRRVLKSEVPDITDAAWTDFVMALRTAALGAVSASNALGMFEMKPRRLGDLGLMRNLRCQRSPTGRLVWVGDFVAPMTQRTFLDKADAQYRAFCDSMLGYVKHINELLPAEGVDDDTTLSGALAILHRCGPSGLRTWNDEAERFSDTVTLYERANGIF